MTSRTKKKVSSQRRGLLAKVHIAKKELGIIDDDYRGILGREFGVTSSAALADRELESLVDYFKSKGWRPQKSDPPEADKGQRQEAQVAALRGRVRQEAEDMGMEARRLRALTRKICGMDFADWCTDVNALKRLAAAIRNIGDREAHYD